MDYRSNRIMRIICRMKWLIIIFLLSGIILNNTIIAQSAPLVLRFGYYTKNFNGGNISEIDGSMKQWIETLKNNNKVKLFAASIAKNTFYDSKDVMIEDIVNKRLDFMNLSTYDFFDLDLQWTIIPMLTTSKSKESKSERYFLLSNKNSAITDISKITKAQIVIPQSFSSELIKVWLQVELKRKIKQSDFAKIEIVESSKKENETLFAIFFNKIEFAVIKEDSYLLASELNPQIKNYTKVIAISKKYINNFFARRKDLDPEIYMGITKAGLNLDKTIEGKQILNLMQMTNMHEINLADLKETELLIKQHRRLFSQIIINK